MSLANRIGMGCLALACAVAGSVGAEHVHGTPPAPIAQTAAGTQPAPGPRFRKITLDTHFWNEGATFGDINRDGVADVVSGPFWYAGPDFKQRHEIYPATETFTRPGTDGRPEKIPGFEGDLGTENVYSDNFFAFVRDFDADGWNDVLFFGFPGKEAAWYRNPRGTPGHWRRHVVFEPLDNESPTFTDIDGDGVPEIVGNSQGYFGYARIPADPAQPWPFHRITTQEGWDTYTHGLGVGDINGDGRMDLIEPAGWWEQPASLAGDPVWRRHKTVFGEGAQFHTYDVNGDDLADVIGSIDAHGYGLAWYEQVRSGKKISFRRHLILGLDAKKNAHGVQFSQLHAVDVVDVDGDGLKDIVTGKRHRAHGMHDDPEANGTPVLYWFKLVREDGKVDFIPKLIDDDSGVGTQLVVTDANGDRRPDIAVANKKGTFVFLQEFGGYTGGDAARAMTLPPGFSAKLFAAEPDVKQPIAFAIDDRGRLWVAESYTYPVRRPEGEGTDRILVFDDTNGDGRYDRRTIFMSQLNLLSAIEVGFGGVWVGAAPQLLYIPLADGDEPKPAGPAQVVLDGWGYEDTHEMLNTFNWGIDGWLYGTHGIFANSAIGVPGTPDAERIKLNAGVWRYHPVKKRFEVFAEGTSNPWGMDFDERGDIITEACVIPHLWHMVQGGRFLRQSDTPMNLSHFNPNTYDDIKTIADHLHFSGENWEDSIRISDDVGGGHAHAGLMIYQGGSWPDAFRGKAYMNNIHGARINVDTLSRRGSGYIGQHAPDFIRFNDPWSQVVNLKYDQDGSVYLIDWYDQEQCHVNRPEIPDRGNGRIFKVVYGDTPTTRIDMGSRSDDELVSDQLDRREWRVRHARRILQERAARGALSAAATARLRAMLGLEGTRPASAPAPGYYELASDEAQLRVLWTLHSTGGLSRADAIRLTARPEEPVRAWAIQLAAEDRDLSDSDLATLAQLARTDSSPVVRRNLASAALRTAPEKRWDLVEALSARAEDAADHNIPLLNWYGFEPLVALDYRRALQIALASKLPRTLEFTARRMISLEDTHGALAALTGALGDVGDEPRQLALLTGMNAGLQGRRDIALPAGWESAEATLSRSANPQIRNELLAVSLVFGSARSVAAARQILADGTAGPEARLRALGALLNVKDPQLQPLLVKALEEPELRGAAIRGLAAYTDPRTPQRLLTLYPTLPTSEKRDVLTTLASRPDFAKPLLAALASGSIPVSDVSADIASHIRALNRPELTASLEKSWGVAQQTGADKTAELARYKTILEPLLPWPDQSHGRQLFKQTCGACHKLFGEGGTIGPDITGSNRADLDYLLHNILNPSAEVPNNYRMATVTLKDGRVLAGFANEQNPQVVAVTTPNETVPVPRKEIASLVRASYSMMPEGLLTPLSDQEVRELISYLRGSELVPLPGEPGYEEFIRR